MRTFDAAHSIRNPVGDTIEPFDFSFDNLIEVVFFHPVNTCIAGQPKVTSLILKNVINNVSCQTIPSRDRVKLSILVT